MINENTDFGEKIIEDGKATNRLQSFFDVLTQYINREIYPYTVATVPDATKNEGRTIYVQDETGGATKAFSDGTNWRRMQDRAIIS